MKHLLMDNTGHTTIEFDASSTVDLAGAMERFRHLTGDLKQRAATRAKSTGEFRLITSFDQASDETLFFSAFKGG